MYFAQRLAAPIVPTVDGLLYIYVLLQACNVDFCFWHFNLDHCIGMIRYNCCSKCLGPQFTSTAPLFGGIKASAG